MRVRVWSLALAAIGAAALLAAACAPASEPKSTDKPADTSTSKPSDSGTTGTKTDGGSTSTTAPKTSVSGIPIDPDAKKGGILNLAYQAEGPNFNVIENKGGVASFAGQPLLNGLLRLRTWGTRDDFEKQAYLELKPDLAASWEQSQDGLTWTFKLRPNVKFSNGQPFTCADVKFTIDMIRTGQGLKANVLGPYFTNVTETTCADDLTFVAKLKNPQSSFLSTVGHPNLVILPKGVYEANPDLMRDKTSIGTGPYTLKQWIPGETYVFERKLDYWDQPLPYLDGLKGILLTTSAIPTAVRAGRVDLYSNAQGGVRETLTKECQHCVVWPGTVIAGPEPALMLNLKTQPWSNVELRNAVSYAIDRVKFSKLVLPGNVLPPTGGIFYPGSEWAMPKERLSQIPGYNFDDPEGNKQKARDILKKLGYAPGQLEMTFNIGVYSKDNAPPIIEDLEMVGIKVKANQLEVGPTYSILGTGDFVSFIHDFYDGGTDPDFPLREHFYTGSQRNYNQYSNPKYDALVELQSMTLDKELRRKLAWDAAEIAMKDQVKIYVGLRSASAVYNRRVHGILPGPNHNTYGAIQRYDHTWVSD